MTPEQMEFSIAQYTDGTLADAERAAVESLLASDPAARQLLGGEQKLTDLLRSAPLPDVRWDRLAASISSAVDHADEPSHDRSEQTSWRMRIRFPAFLAAAASVLLAAGLALHLLVGGSNGSSQPGPNTQPPGALLVAGPVADEPTGRVVTEIAISAGGSYSKDESLAPYADDIDSRPARVIIASGMTIEQAPPGSPF